jgi:hypothetical protein
MNGGTSEFLTRFWRIRISSWRKEKHVAQDKRADEESQQAPEPGESKADAMEEAQKEAAEEREEEGGYQ